MNSSKKESIAITAITNEINKYDNLQEYFNKRDKEPVWDGKIELYKGDSNKTIDIVGEIPVQIKGTDAKNNKEAETYYDVKISDIENYRKTNVGTIYFVVEIDENRNTKIFYKEFDLKTIEKILEETKTKNNKTKRFKFATLANNSLSTICIEFINKLKIYKEIKPIKEIEVYDKQTLCYNYNTKYELNEIKKSNKVFYETNAYKEAKDKLEKQNIVILHGEPWVGKTSTARKLVSNYIEQGYMFVYGNVDDLPKIKDQVAIDAPIICLLDDFLGSNIQYLEKNIAESTLDKIVSIFRNTPNKKLIFTTRTYIYNNAKGLFYKFHKATSIKNEYLIDVANYTYEEKGNILYNHMKINNLIGTETHKQLVEEEFYVDVITHDNFNPGVIALICERLKNKRIKNVKEYIKKALNDPDALWEEEYQKLTNYEKIILIIIVLYGVKVPELYVKEQFDKIIEDENITLLDSETFTKSIHTLSDSFVKVTFNDMGEKELEVCKHSVADYIINKVKYREIDLERYINSAIYAETLYYISMIYKNDGIAEKLAQKAEKEFESIKGFCYISESIMFDLIKKCITPKRKKFLQNIIDQELIRGSARIIIDILDREDDVLYGYTVKRFQELVIEDDGVEILYDLRDVLEWEIFFKTYSEICDYQKDTEFMISNFYIILETLAQAITEDVENTINEILPEHVAKEIAKGKKMTDIINEHIKAIFLDEIPSLSNLYSKKFVNKMLKELYEYCYVSVDEEILQEELDKLENGEEDETPIYYKYSTIDKEQVKAIKAKFEKGISVKRTKNISEDYYKMLSSLREYGKWWIESFTNENDYDNYDNLKLYKEFINIKTDVDKSVNKLAQQFLDYLLHEKNNVSKEAEDLLTKIAYESFLDGEFSISAKKMKEYQNKYPEELKQLYKTKVLLKKNGQTKIINTYIHLFVAVNELIRTKDILIHIIIDWSSNMSEKNMNDSIQKIFYLYSELNRKEFNEYYVGTSLAYFTKEVKYRYNNIGKMKASKAIINFIEPTIFLDRTFEYMGSIKRMEIIMDIVEFVTGANLELDLSRFDYGIYQKELYKNCYSEEFEEYEINFSKIIENVELKKLFDKLKVWDYFYNIYLKCEKALNILYKDDETDMHKIGESLD